MENITITAATPEELRSGELGRKLRHYNYGFVGEYPEQQYIRLNARDASGRSLGGLRGFVFLYWLSIEVLFVEADVRGSGLGSRLIAEAERQAIKSRWCAEHRYTFPSATGNERVFVRPP